MLRLTDTAAGLIGRLSTQPDLPDTAGLRIESASAPGTGEHVRHQ